MLNRLSDASKIPGLGTERLSYLARFQKLTTLGVAVLI